MTSSRGNHMKRAGTLIAAAVAALVVSAPAFAAAPTPAVVRDVMTGMDNLGSFGPFTTEPDWVQPDTQIEPSIAVNPANPCNVVTAYQEGRIDSGGDATNGYTTSTDCGATWKYGELPGLTTYGQGTAVEQGGYFERASDAVVAFGPDNTVYANSLVFDSSGQSESGGLRSGMAVNVSHNGGLTWGPPVIFQDDQIDGTNDKNWIVVDNSDAPGHHKGRVYVVWDRIAPVVYNYCDDHCDEPSHWLPNFQTVHGVVWPGQGLGAYPVVLKSGGLGMAIGSLTPGIPTRQTDNPDVTNLGH